MSMPCRYRAEVAAYLDREFRSGGAKPDLADFLDPIEERFGPADEHVTIDLPLLRALFAKAAEMDLNDNELDAWLAKRLHYALRISRRVAGDKGFWTWLAVEAAGPYIRHRWLGKNPSDPDVVTMHRYVGPVLRNAPARLWWGAELVRNGPSYDYVDHVFARVWTAEYALELKYSWYRAAAIAFVRVAEGLASGSPKLSTEQAKDLSVRVNSYLSLRALEQLGLYEVEDEQPDYEWRSRKPTEKEVLEGMDFRGPNDGFADEDATEKLAAWYVELLGDLGGEPERAA